jgi:dienelactone hydrolase
MTENRAPSGTPAPAPTLTQSEIDRASGARYEMHMYPGTLHGLHTNSTPRYHEASAPLAWERTIAFFKPHLA